jgi:hypothetical protein
MSPNIGPVELVMIVIILAILVAAAAAVIFVVVQVTGVGKRLKDIEDRLERMEKKG